MKKKNRKQSRSEKMVEERKKIEFLLPFLYSSSCSRLSEQNINQKKG